MKSNAGPTSESVSLTSSTLLRRVQAQDQDAWDRLLHLYGPLVDFWIRRAGLQLADAQDVFQEVFQAVATGIHRFRKVQPGDTFRGWLRTVVRSKVANYRQRAGSLPMAVGGTEALRRLQEVPGAEEPSREATEADALRDLRLRGLELIRAEFESRTWQAFWYVTVEGRAAKDVAADLGVTPAAVRLAKSRVLRRLREELGDQGL